MTKLNNKIIANALAIAFLGTLSTPFAFAQGTVTCNVVDTKSISANDLFDFDKSTLSANGQKVLNAYADNIRNMKSVTDIFLTGHTDGKGTVDYNLALGQRRADAVKAFLASKGVDPKIVQATSRGKADLLNNELTPDGKDDPIKRQANRRVEITTAGTTVLAGANCPTPVAKAPAPAPAGGPVAAAAAEGSLNPLYVVGGVIAVGAIIAVAVSNDGGGSTGTTGTTGTSGQ